MHANRRLRGGWQAQPELLQSYFWGSHLSPHNVNASRVS